MPGLPAQCCNVLRSCLFLVAAFVLHKRIYWVYCFALFLCWMLIIGGISLLASPIGDLPFPILIARPVLLIGCGLGSYVILRSSSHAFKRKTAIPDVVWLLLQIWLTATIPNFF